MKSDYSLVILNHARQDLEDIFAYIENTLFNQKAVEDLYGAFHAAFESICSFPFSSKRSDFRFEDVTLYKRPVKNYLLFYTVDPNEKEISIVRILYAARNLHDIL